MTTATLDDVSRWTERDSFFLLFAQTARSAAKDVTTWLFLPFCIPGVVILAQLFPSRVLTMLGKLNAVLPNVTDTDDLELIRDALKLTYGAAKYYRHFSIFRASAQEAVWELSETVDSIEFVLNNKQELKEFVTASEARRTPELPLIPARKAAG